MSDELGAVETTRVKKPRRYVEQRILVLHNADFGETSDGDPAFEARADVVNQAHDVARALVSRGHFVDVLGVDTEDLPGLFARLQEDPPDLIFNLIESLSRVDKYAVAAPALLDLFGVAYTGASVAAFVLSQDKLRSKQLLTAENVQTPRAALVGPLFRSHVADLAAVAGFGYPLIVKFADESGSFGLSADSVCSDGDALVRHLRTLRERHPGRRMFVEQYIEGRELNVALLGNRLLPTTEIDFSHLPPTEPRILTYDAKWKKDSVGYQRISGSKPAVGLPSQLAERIRQMAERAFSALGLCDYGRVDLRLSQDGTPYVLEVNPNCDLSDGAGLSMAAKAAGLSYEDLVDEVAQSALNRSRNGMAQSEPP